MSTAIPMVDPAAEYRSLKAEIDAAVGRVLASGRSIGSRIAAGPVRVIPDAAGLRLFQPGEVLVTSPVPALMLGSGGSGRRPASSCSMMACSTAGNR